MARKAAANTEPLYISRRRVAAIVLQLISFWATYLFIEALMGPTLAAVGIAAIIEWALFEARREVANGRYSVSGIAAAAIDAVLNAGGLWGFVLKLDQAEAYQMIADSLRLGDEMRMIPALIIALSIGTWLSFQPFRLWREED